jgi:Ca2+/Na+ antiporter
MAFTPKSHQDDKHEHAPFPPILNCAVVLGVLIRFLEIYFFVTSTGDGVFFIWQFPVFGPLGVADLLLICTLLILVVALLEAILDPRNRARWGAVIFCLLLVVYSGGIQFSSQQMMEP